MSLYKSYKTDTQLEQEGITLDFGNAGKIKIARAGGSNQRYNARIAAARKPYQRQIAIDGLTDDLMHKILVPVYVDTIVVGWDDIKDEHGNDMEFNKGNALKLFNDLPDFFAQIVEEANRLSNFRSSDIEDIVKNS